MALPDSATVRPIAPPRHHVGTEFDAASLATCELRMWKAYSRRQPARLFGYLVRALPEQGHASWPRAL